MDAIKNLFAHLKLPMLLGLGLFVYLVLRVFMVAMTDDECITMQFHVYENWWSVLTHGLENQGWAGNNHVLNSLFMKLELLVFGKQDWALRLHILGAFIVCYYYTFKTIEQITASSVHQFCYLALIFVNAYFLDFFAISRGYALSLAGGAGAFYYFTQYAQTPDLKHLRNAVIGLFAAVWANYSALYVAFFFGFLFLNAFYRHRKSDFALKHFAYLVLGYVAIGIVNGLPLYKTLVANNAYGGIVGFFHDTICGTVELFIHHNIRIDRFAKFNETWTNVEAFSGIAIVLWVSLQAFSLVLKTDKPPLRKVHLQALFITLGVVLLVKTLFLLFKTPLPMGRTVLLFYGSFLVSTVAAFAILVHRYRALNALLALATAFSFWHAYETFNLDNTREWWQAGDAKRVISYMNDYINNQKSQKILKLGGESYQYFPLVFYAEPRYNDILKVVFTDMSKDGDFDFLFVPTFRKKDVWQGYEEVAAFKHGVLFKKSEK